MGLIGKFDCPIYLHRADYQLFINDDLNGYNEYKIERPYQVKDLFIKFVDDETLNLLIFIISLYYILEKTILK